MILLSIINDVTPSQWQPLPTAPETAPIDAKLSSSAAVEPLSQMKSKNGCLHRVAKPILERWRVPATVFLATRMLGCNEYWWDRLERMIFGAVSLPEIVHLQVRDGSVLVPLCSKDRADAFWGIRRHLLYVDPRTPNLQLDRLAEIMKPIAETRDRRLLTNAEVRNRRNRRRCPWQ